MPAARRRFATLAVVLAFLLSVSAQPTPAMTILPLDLPALTAQADRIFVGRVTRVASGRDASGLPATWTTFVVSEELKGVAGRELTVKQLGTSLGEAGGATILPHPALPQYRPGESVVLFIQPESALGFTSPVGLGQGCFRIRSDGGRSVAENDVGNRNLAGAPTATAHTSGADAAAAAAPRAALPLDTLVGRVRALVDATH